MAPVDIFIDCGSGPMTLSMVSLLLPNRCFFFFFFFLSFFFRFLSLDEDELEELEEDLLQKKKISMHIITGFHKITKTQCENINLSKGFLLPKQGLIQVLGEGTHLLFSFLGLNGGIFHLILRGENVVILQENYPRLSAAKRSMTRGPWAFMRSHESNV